MSLSRSPRALRAGFFAAALAALASCGFHLRGDARYDFGSLYVNAPSAGLLATELRRTIASGSEATIVDKPEAAQAILDITDYRDDKSVLSLSGGGRVREYLLTKHVAFRLHDAEGRDWLPPGEITIRRNYSYNEAEALAREQQEARLLREMQSDAVAQIVRRLQAAKKPA
jgi:LPS-assembly lipoprotein